MAKRGVYVTIVGVAWLMCAEACLAQCTSDPDCDDAVACTVDRCTILTGVCTNTAFDSLCTNNIFCDGAERCDAIQGCLPPLSPVICSDGVPCTVDTCDEANSTCVSTPNDALCDNTLFCDGIETCTLAGCVAGTPIACGDGITCTIDTCNEGTDSCSNSPTDSFCNDFQFCTGTESCNPSDPGADPTSGCLAGTPVACNDGIACTQDTCNDFIDTCEFFPNDLLCDNGIFCDGIEACDVNTGCVIISLLDCDDGIACTVDTCDEINQVCINTPSDALCDNGMFCDGAETCDALLDCQAGAVVNCDDGVGCTDDSCDEVGDACVNAANDGLCDNSLFCDGAETCDPLLDCQLGITVNCDDGVLCTVDSCDEVNDVCSNLTDDVFCDNGIFCDGAEVCDSVLDCQFVPAVDCNDNVGCTVDSCDEVNDTCVNTIADALCDDGLFCTGVETCDPVLDCLAGGNPCPGLACDEPSGLCVPCTVDPECDDGQFCNGLETCVAGACIAGVPVVCDDGIGCTLDSCDEFADVCVNATNDTLCDNGLFCDGVEICDVLLDCQPGPAVNCDDGVGCTTVDVCDEVNDVCVNTPSDAFCDNGQFCDGVETCDSILDCLAGVVVSCDDGVPCTDDSCDEIGNICVNAPNDGLCDNGQFCDGVETCDAVLDCQAGTPVNCSDGVSCTSDLCNETIDACTNMAADVLCNDGQFCNGVETCDAVLDCQPGVALTCDDGVACTTDSCDEIGDQCLNIPDNTACDNGLFCDGAETCDAVLDCVASTFTCDDAVGCTVDTCNETTDVCIFTPVDGLCDNGIFCDGAETCDSLLDCQVGIPLTCDDAVVCTIDSCDELNAVCVNTPDDTACDNAAFCDGVETCDPLLDCQSGAPVDCNDAVACTIDTCDEVNDVCANTPSNGLCNTGLFCDGNSICDAVLDCQVTAPPCNDGNDCTTDVCDEGTDSCIFVPIAGCQECIVDGHCDDGIACTLDECIGSSCVNTPLHSSCDNGLFCDGAELCDTLLGCQAGDATICDDGIACTTDGCDESTDTCIRTPNDALCANGLFCDGVEVCDQFSGCVAGPSPCDDGVACTVNACNEFTDTCIVQTVDSYCDNGVFCDGIETCHQFFDCEPGPLSCDDGIDCTADTCNEATDGCTNTPLDGLCDDGVVINGTEICDPDQGCIPGPAPTVVSVVTVVRQVPSGVDTAIGQPPVSDAEIREGSTFVVELWAQQAMNPATPPMSGLCCAFVDLQFDPTSVSCLSVAPGPDYDSFNTGTCVASGTVDELGGCTLIVDTGVTPDWVRISTVTLSANATQFGATINSVPANTPISVCQFGNVGVNQTSFGDVTFSIRTPCIYDLDSDDSVGPGDLALLAPCWLRLDTDPLWNTFSCARADFDCSSVVDPGDLSFFATAWLRSCQDPLIVFPAGPCGVPSGQFLPPATQEMVESFGLPYPIDDDDEEDRAVRRPAPSGAGGSGTISLDSENAVRPGSRVSEKGGGRSVGLRGSNSLEGLKR